MTSPQPLATELLSAIYGAVRSLQLYPSENEVETLRISVSDRRRRCSRVARASGR